MKVMNVTNYDEMLKMGQTLASGQWEESFMSDTSDKYDKYGQDMFVSDKQVAVLARISGIDPLIDMEAKPPERPAPANNKDGKPF